jgi:hypothetical protein
MGMEKIRAVKKYILDSEQTLPYFIDHIKCGKVLSRLIINKINFHEGTFFTILPSQANIKQMYEFSYGGIISPTCSASEIYQCNEGTSEMQILTMDSECSEFILRFMEKDIKNVAIIENYMLDSNMLRSHNKNIKSIAYKNDVYFILNKKNSIEEIYKTIRISSQVWHSLFILTKIKDERIINFNENLINEIFDNAEYIITGAYDEESYVFWEKNLHKFEK